jgi:heme o synthase
VYREYFQLSKIRIMLPIAFTGFTGFFLLDPSLSLKALAVTFGILLQAVASSVLNQLQEVDLDRKMNRTSKRPLPTGTVSKVSAVLFFLFCLTSGTLLIYFYGNLTAALTGLFTIFWYNVIYTYSKRITAFAVVPGSLTGALPPFIGWTAAGGALLDKPIIFLGFMLFVGQVPHFWLLVIKYGEEYGKAGIPSLTRVLSLPQINRLTFTWVVTSAVSGLFLAYFKVFHSKPVIAVLLASSLYLVWSFRDMSTGTEKAINFRRNFILLNSYFLLILILLIADRIVVSP